MGIQFANGFVTNLSAVETKLTGSKKTAPNATLQLISGQRFQKTTHNLKDLCTTYFCIQHDLLVRLSSL